MKEPRCSTLQFSKCFDNDVSIPYLMLISLFWALTGKELTASAKAQGILRTTMGPGWSWADGVVACDSLESARTASCFTDFILLAFLTFYWRNKCITSSCCFSKGKKYKGRVNDGISSEVKGNGIAVGDCVPGTVSNGKSSQDPRSEYSHQHPTTEGRTEVQIIGVNVR